MRYVISSSTPDSLKNNRLAAPQHNLESSSAFIWWAFDRHARDDRPRGIDQEPADLAAGQAQRHAVENRPPAFDRRQARRLPSIDDAADQEFMTITPSPPMRVHQPEHRRAVLAADLGHDGPPRRQRDLQAEQRQRVEQRGRDDVLAIAHAPRATDKPTAASRRRTAVASSGDCVYRRVTKSANSPPTMQPRAPPGDDAPVNQLDACSHRPRASFK